MNPVHHRMTMTKRNVYPLISCLLLAALIVSPSFSAEPVMIRLAGTPEQIGATWGEMNKETIRRDVGENYLKKAVEKGISKETLLKRSAASIRIIEEIAPHWLVEARAVARAADVPEDVYVAYLDGVVRQRFLGEDPEECTSYAVSPKFTRDGAIMFHKTRDNRNVAQAVYVVDSSFEGINKFIAVSNATGMAGFSMMVNEKGLAGCGDYPANRKKDSSKLHLESAPDKYRGVMGGTILRHIAETASNCEEALAIIEKCVAAGWYAGGKVGGNHWLFVDREGTVLEVCNNPGHVVSKVHTQKAYFSRLNKSAAAKRLRESEEPIDFHLFHNVSRDRSICLGSSISGMTVEIDPARPELFTCAWITLPVKSVAFPVFMGQNRTPKCLLDGEVYALGKTIKGKARLWESVERTTHVAKERLVDDLAADLSEGGKPEATAKTLEGWSAMQAGMLLEVLGALQDSD